LYAKELTIGDQFVDKSGGALTWLSYTVIGTHECKLGTEVEAEDQYGDYHLLGPMRQVELVEKGKTNSVQ